MTRTQITQEQLEYLLAQRAGYTGPAQTPYDSPFLRLLVTADRGPLSQSFTELYCDPGEIIFHEGDPGDSMFLIYSGQVAILKNGLDSPTILAYRQVGELFGEMSILDSQPRSATVVALEKTRLMEISRQRFEQLIDETPGVGRSIMEMLSATLRQASQERSSGELSEKRLSQQVSALQSEKERLEELQKLRQETSELIIHDLRNPLSAVAVALKMLAITLPDEVLHANQEILGVAQASAERMQRLVDSLLEVSRMQDGNLPFAMGAVDLQALISDLARRMAILSRPGVVILSQVEPDLPPATADRDKIERVLMNLLDNALKYTPEHGRVILAAARQGDWLQVSVSDDGPGIPPEQRQRIFQRFAQLDDRRAARRGFGLGLTYCRLAVERHGGRIWVEDGEDSTGSRFIFTLPSAR
jgi:signal transduction histidine kinase